AIARFFGEWKRSQSRSTANPRRRACSRSRSSLPATSSASLNELLQRVEARRLLHVVIEARRAPVDLALAPPRQADEAARHEIGPCLERTDEHVAADVRESDVDHGNGRLERIDGVKRFFAALGGRHLAAAALEQQAKQRA